MREYRLVAGAPDSSRGTTTGTSGSEK